MLILGAPLAAWVLACGWLGAGLTRIISTRLDNALNLPNIAGIVVELAIGGGLLV